MGLPASGPSGQPVYWIGSDNNAYLKAPVSGTSGGWVTTNVGPASQYPNGHISGATQIANPNPTQPSNNGGPSPGGGNNTGGGNPNTNPLIQQGILQEYGGALAGANALYGQNEANRPVNIDALNNYTNAQENAARQQTQGQVDVYNQQAEGVKGQRDLSLSELLDQIRGQHQGLQAQLGAVGAGSSSAAGMGDFALQKQRNIQSANINQQAGSNIANINKESQAAQANLQPYINVIEGYKQQQLNQINQNYQQVRTNLQQAMAQASGEEKRQLGLFAQGLQTAATNALVNLDAQVNQARAGASQKSQADFLGPQFQARPQAAAPNPVTSTQVSPFTPVNSPAAGSSDAPGLLGLLQKQQQTV